MLRLPAEWEPQDAVLLAWPHADTDWEPCLAEVEPVYLELVRQICRFEKVILVTPHLQWLENLIKKQQLPRQQITLAQCPTNDTWTRDFGPVTVQKAGTPHLLDFGFNGWGRKFASHLDNKVNRCLHQHGFFGKTSLESISLILEGGSIESDGSGTILTTTQCLTETNRNPQWSRTEIESQLSQHLGGQHFLWLEHGYLAGDDTDSHIDTLARFAPDATILYVHCNQPDDEHYPELHAMEQELKHFTTAHGEPYRLSPLPWPAPRFDDEGNRLPATYANFLIINQAVLVPTYDDPADSLALEIIRQAFPDREIIPINSLPLIEQHGSLHCISMQIPEGVLP